MKHKSGKIARYNISSALYVTSKQDVTGTSDIKKNIPVPVLHIFPKFVGGSNLSTLSITYPLFCMLHLRPSQEAT